MKTRIGIVFGIVGLGVLSLPLLSQARLFASLGMQHLTAMSITLPYAAPPSAETWKSMTAVQRLNDVDQRVKPALKAELAAQGLKLGQQAFVRIFKASREFELWLKNDNGEWKRFRNYPIAIFSGELGPKLAEGDGQAPEGIYDIVKERLNPASKYHLAFNIGYPNAFDRHHGRTGSLIMVHGDCVSIGCFAMTDPVIEEIYLIIAAALHGGQDSIAVHSFPFRMTAERMQQATSEASPWLDFWKSLQPIHDAFEHRHTPPSVSLQKGVYRLR